MRWRVRLSGDGFLLQQLPKLVVGPDLAVTQDAERTYLEAASLQALNDAASIASAAEPSSSAFALHASFTSERRSNFVLTGWKSVTRTVRGLRPSS
jgi:uncharacterized membrane protein